MKYRILIILVIIQMNAFTFISVCRSQNLENIHDCRVLSIDSVNVGIGLSSRYYVIYLDSEIGKIVLIKPNPDFDTVLNIADFHKGIIFNLFAKMLDSVPIYGTDTTYYMKFENLRGGNGGFNIYFGEGDREGPDFSRGHIDFEDYNYFPYKPISLNDQKKIELMNNCKIISIDSLSILPNHYFIKARSKKEDIYILSKFKKSSRQHDKNRLKLNRKYDFYLVKVDSEYSKRINGKYCLDFIYDSISNTITRIDTKEKRLLELPNYLNNLYKSINLNGIDYSELRIFE